jgi:hypothetical protein
MGPVSMAPLVLENTKGRQLFVTAKTPGSRLKSPGLRSEHIRLLMYQLCKRLERQRLIQQPSTAYFPFKGIHGHVMSTDGSVGKGVPLVNFTANEV